MQQFESLTSFIYNPWRSQSWYDNTVVKITLTAPLIPTNELLHIFFLKNKRPETFKNTIAAMSVILHNANMN